MINNCIKLSFEHVLFFGRSLSDYEAMFGLDILQWKECRMLDCPSGPSSFVVEARQQGIEVFGCDPLYGDDIEQLIMAGKADVELMVAQQQLAPQLFDQKLFLDTNLYKQKRLGALNLFLEDYQQGIIEGHYFKASLPAIPHPDGYFDLVLSANLLFFYSDIQNGGCLAESALDYDFHLKAVLELYRLCSKEVRIYPLKGPNATTHLYLAPLIKDLKRLNIHAVLQPVPYRGMSDAEHMLSLTKH